MAYGYRRRYSFRRPSVRSRFSNFRRPAFRKYSNRSRAGVVAQRRGLVKASLNRRPAYAQAIGPPRSVFMKLKYADTFFNMSTAGGGFQTLNAFSGNSPYDPDATGVGVQPHFYDELGAIYSRYNCYASKIKCTFYCVTALSACGKQIVSVYPAVQSAAMTNNETCDLIQLPHCKQLQLGLDKNQAQKKVVVKNYVKTREYLRGANVNDADYVASVSNNPTRRWYWHVATDTADSAAACTIWMDVEITYYIKFMLRDNVDQS